MRRWELRGGKTSGYSSRYSLIRHFWQMATYWEMLSLPLESLPFLNVGFLSQDVPWKHLVKGAHRPLKRLAVTAMEDQYPVLCIQNTGLRCGTSPYEQLKDHVAILCKFLKNASNEGDTFCCGLTIGRIPDAATRFSCQRTSRWVKFWDSRKLNCM